MHILFILFVIALSAACGDDDAAPEASRTFPARSACVEGLEASDERRSPLSGEPVTAVELGAPTRLVLPNRPDQHYAVALGSLGADMSMQLMIISPSVWYNRPDSFGCVNLNYSSQDDVECKEGNISGYGYFDQYSALIHNGGVSGRYFYYESEYDYKRLRLSTKVYREGQVVLELPQVQAQSVVTSRGLQLVTAGDELAALSKAGEVVWSLKGSSMPERFIEFYASQTADHREGEPLTMLARSAGGVSLLELDDCGGYKVRYTLDKEVDSFSPAAHIGARMVVVSGQRDTHIYTTA